MVPPVPVGETDGDMLLIDARGDRIAMFSGEIGLFLGDRDDMAFGQLFPFPIEESSINPIETNSYVLRVSLRLSER